MFKIKKSPIFFYVILQIAFSQSIQEMQKLKQEYERMQNQTSLSIPNQQNQINPAINNNTDPSQISIVPYDGLSDRDSTVREHRYFGYDFFTKRDTIGFWENLSIPKNYVLGPGDEIVISLWGETSLRQTFTISRSGKIYDEKVGILNVAGKTTDQAKEYILNQFGRIYSTLNGQNPSSFLDISLVD